MTRSTNRLHILSLVTALLAVILPVLTLGDSRQPSGVDHAGMMTMAGHVMPMSGTEAPDDGSLMLLCQQHCLFAAAVMPRADRPAEKALFATDVMPGADVHAASLAALPPGPPPKVAEI